MSQITSLGSANGGGGVASVTGGTGINITGTATNPIVNLTVPVTVPHGGTGQVTLTQYGVVVGNGAGAVAITAAGTTGQILTAVTGGNPTWQAPAGTTNLTYTGVNHAASPYTVLATDEYISADVTGGVITIRLPNAPATGRVYIIKDKVGLAATSNITVTTVGGAVNIDGATSFVINTAYESIQVIFNAVSYEVF